uniref:ISXO2-like transposase domain-containing protein n=1 Tax=Trichuris muris TaxID=70415 RepID=A0A5S6Q345_TRIMR
MRFVAEEWVLKNPVPVGDPGLTVEVGESMFARHKYNRGRVLPQAWVVGVSGAHTQTVESLWSHAKQVNKSRRGTQRSKLDSYLYEFIWRRWLNRDEYPFDKILCAIAELYPTSLRAVHAGGAVSENRDIVPRVNSP